MTCFLKIDTSKWNVGSMLYLFKTFIPNSVTLTFLSQIVEVNLSDIVEIHGLSVIPTD